MANLLPPRAGGAFAAIDSAPTADVIFVAHTGLDDLITMRDVWRALPMEQVIKAKWWRVPAAEVPRERTEVVAWLYDWWERIDAWIEANRPVRPEMPTSGELTPSQRLSSERTPFRANSAAADEAQRLSTEPTPGGSATPGEPTSASSSVPTEPSS